MLALCLPREIERRLSALAKKTGGTKTSYAREVLVRHIEDLEDRRLARRRLASRMCAKVLKPWNAKSRAGGETRNNCGSLTASLGAAGNHIFG